MNQLDFASYGLPEKAEPKATYPRVFQPTFLKILRQSGVPKPEWHDLFSTVHRYVMWAEEDQAAPQCLYECLKDDAVQSVTLAHHLIATEHDDQLFLQKYVSQWRDYHRMSQTANLPFISVDHSLLEVEGKTAEAGTTKPAMVSDIGPIRRMLMQVWNEVVLTPFAQRLLKIVAEMLMVERDEGLTYDDLIVGVRDSFYCVSPQRRFFEENYESVYIATLERYYSRATASQFENGSVVDYAYWAEKTFHDEHVRAKKYLIPSPHYQEPIKRMNSRLIELVLRETPIFEAITQTAFRLVEEHRSEPLAVMYRLLDRVQDGLEPLVGQVRDYIVRKGKEDMLESSNTVYNDAEKYVEKLLALYRMFAQLVKEAFCDDHRFTSARDRGFQEVVNDTSVFSLQLKGRAALAIESRCPEMLANFCDSLLRKTTLSRRLGSEEISTRLRDSLQVLKYVTNKDVFMQMYQTTLARRLILGHSVDSDLEEEMSRWLANLGMPAEVINRMNRMFNDIRISEDLSAAWNAYIYDKDLKFRIGEMDPKVLNVCSWSRPGERTSCTISPDLEEFLAEFEKWYCGRFQGRKLVIAGSSTTMVLQFSSRMGTYELEVTMLQNAVLRAFQDSGKAKLTFEAIQMATAIPEVELRRTFWTLCILSKCGNRVMGYAPEVTSAKDYLPDTRFWINLNFAPIRGGRPQKRGRINLIGKLQIGTSDRLGEEDQEGIAALRELRVQEAVTKVMKTRKTATMTEIHTETIEILKNWFLPNRRVLKEQIEFLVEKEYLTRDERDLNVFHYLA